MATLCPFVTDARAALSLELVFTVTWRDVVGRSPPSHPHLIAGGSGSLPKSLIVGNGQADVRPLATSPEGDVPHTFLLQTRKPRHRGQAGKR